jgi:2-hydroxy-3-keto-5-methylthiopentenyl-1-phosphate phosphatase
VEEKKHFEYIVFSDFDGSITKVDTLEAFIKANVDVDVDVIAAQMVKDGVTVRDGVRELVAMITPAQYEASIGDHEQLELREGFSEFLDFLAERGIPMVVISGGIDRMVEKNLEPYRDRIEGVYAAKVDLSGERVYFHSDYESNEEMVEKTKIMRQYDFGKSICIGDSYTDIIMSTQADIVFARDRLAKALDSEQVKYYPYETFHDIIDVLGELL